MSPETGERDKAWCTEHFHLVCIHYIPIIFSLYPSSIPVSQIIASVKSGLSKIPEDETTLVQKGFSCVLLWAKLPPYNIPPHLRSTSKISSFQLIKAELLLSWTRQSMMRRCGNCLSQILHQHEPSILLPEEVSSVAKLPALHDTIVIITSLHYTGAATAPLALALSASFLLFGLASCKAFSRKFAD